MATIEAIREQTGHWAEEPVAEVVPPFTDILTKAELARQRTDHEFVDGVFTAVTVFDLQRQEYLDQTILHHAQTPDEEIDARLLYAGIGRIQHVDANSQIGSLPMDQRPAVARQRIEPVERLYEDIDIATLPPRTAHGSTIHWLGRITADRMKTLERLGDKDQARKGLEQSVSDVRKELAQIAEDPQGEKREYEIPDTSLLGVLYNQHGRLTKDQQEVLQALKVTRKAHAQQQNTHELATISIHTIATSLLPGYQGTLGTRIEGVKKGVTSFLKAFQEDRIAAKQAKGEKKEYEYQSINALTQFFSHAKDRLKEK